MENNFSEKYKLDEMIESFSVIRNFNSEEGMDCLFKLLEFDPKTKQLEIYKYTLFFFIINRKKVEEILLNRKLENSKIEKLKGALVNFLKPDENFKISNEIFKQMYPEVFKNESQYFINKNKINRNNSGNGVQVERSQKLVFEEKIVFDHYPIQMQNANTVRNENPLEKSQSNHSNQLKEFINPQIIKNNIPQKNFELAKKDDTQNFQNIFHHSSSNSSSQSNILYGGDLPVKAIEDLKNKIDEVIRKLNSSSFNECINSIIAGQLELFSHPGYFNETASKLKLLPVDYKLKFLTIYSKLFFIFKENQKKRILEKIKSEVLSDTLLDTRTSEIILNNLFYSLKFQALRDQKVPVSGDIIFNTLNSFYKKIDNPKEEIIKLMKCLKSKSDVTDLFYIFTLNKIFFFLDETTYFKLIFILYLVLTQLSLFNSEFTFLYDLYMIKIFYHNKNMVLSEFIQRNEEGEAIYLNHNLSNLENSTIDYKSLFEEKEVNFCKEVLKTISNFFKIDSNFFNNQEDDQEILTNPASLLNTKTNNYDFTMNIVEMCLQKRKFIYNNPQNYKNNLIHLEKSLFFNYLQFNKDYNRYPDSFNIKIYSEQHEVYVQICNLVQGITAKFFNNNRISVTVYPFGSITQFLGSKESDLDIYLQIQSENYEHKINFMNTLSEQIRHKYGNRNLVVTKRLITITFTADKNIKVDLNYFGVCSVLNSTLLRVYAQCDMRFVILAYNVKLLLKYLGINHTDTVKNYFNSFTWMMLLVTFLQDVISPPVLPKILNKSQPKNIRVETADSREKKKDPGNSKKDRANYYSKRSRNLTEVISKTQFEEYAINISFNEQFTQIYAEFNKKFDCKNEMSLSELMLKFLEFVIFYFKHDTVFMHTSFSGECFMNRSDIKNLEISDRHFYRKHNYLTKKGDYLVREPFDYTYNPAQMQNSHTKDFIEKLKYFYFQLLETGKFPK